MTEIRYVSRYTSPLGGITLASDGEYLTGLWFDGQTHFPSLSGYEKDGSGLPAVIQTVKWLDAYFGGEIPDFTPPLRFELTPFQEEVCAAMLKIPYGETSTYGAIAKEIARKRGVARTSAQAVGGAVGRNPVSLIVPCHRVVGYGGSLTGYAGGLYRKAALLELEKKTVNKKDTERK